MLLTYKYSLIALSLHNEVEVTPPFTQIYQSIMAQQTATSRAIANRFQWISLLKLNHGPKPQLSLDTSTLLQHKKMAFYRNQLKHQISCNIYSDKNCWACVLRDLRVEHVLHPRKT
jgi:hypothetical protein